MRPLPLLAALAVPVLGLARPAWGAGRALLGVLQARRAGRAPSLPRTLHARLGGLLGPMPEGWPLPALRAVMIAVAMLAWLSLLAATLLAAP